MISSIAAKDIQERLNIKVGTLLVPKKQIMCVGVNSDPGDWAIADSWSDLGCVGSLAGRIKTTNFYVKPDTSLIVTEIKVFPESGVDLCYIGFTLFAEEQQSQRFKKSHFLIDASYIKENFNGSFD